eukprot:CFRG3607T1
MSYVDIDVHFDLQRNYLDVVKQPAFSTWAGKTISSQWQQNISETLLAIVILGVIDLLCARHSPARYFILHAVVNAGVILIVYKDFFAVFIDPLGNDQIVEHSAVPLVYAIHIYHVLFFADLTIQDWMHHLLNVLVMGAVAEYWFWGKGVNATCFIMNGVPGGIDYVLLTLVKHKIISPLTEKSINSYLNIMIRLPGMIIVTYQMLLMKLHNKLPNNPWITLIAIVVLECGNAIYFCQRVVGNWHVSAYKEAQRTSKKNL